MKCLLVNPPARLSVYGKLSELAAIEIPVWAGILADYIESKGYPVEILDCEAEGLDVETSAKRIREISPDLAVFCVYGQQPSASTQCLPAAEAVAKLCGQRTICLGTHPSALPHRTLSEGPWTYLCQGEGPETVVGLLNVLEGSWGIQEVPGLWWRFGNQIKGNPPAQNILDLDSTLPTRGLDRFDMKKYRAHNWHSFGGSREGYASIQTSLGCPFKCSFCCINAPFGGASIRHWSAKNVIESFRYLKSQGIRNVKIPDEMFVLNAKHVEDICDGLIELDGDFNIWAYARVDTVKPILLEKMKRAGFNWLGIGIESGSKHVRDGVEKGRFGDEKIEAVVSMIRSHDIAVGANYIFGLPDDDHDSMRETLDLALRLNTEWANFYCAMAYPGSPLYRTAIQNGWKLPETWLGYSQHARESLPLPTEKLTAGEVLKFRDEAFVTYYNRAEYQSMLREKFGQCAVDDIHRMLEHQITRDHY